MKTEVIVRLAVDALLGKAERASVAAAIRKAVENGLVTPEETAEAEPERVLKRALLAKDDGEERYVLGVVMEPDEVDTQGDTQSAADIRKAAFAWMEQYRGGGTAGHMGLQHAEIADDEFAVLESYIQKGDAEINGQAVKDGTWMMSVRVLDDDRWAEIKKGEWTGFSIGGYATREPV